MKAVFKAKAEPGFEIKDAEIPQIKDDEILVKICATSICGTDVHIWKWDEWAQKRIKPPLVIGHEFCGEVMELGKNALGLEKGDLVSGETHINCGYCFQCKTGNAHICENVKFRGIDTTGCFSEYHVMPANTAWKNDPSIPIEVMSAQEPLGNAVHATFKEDVSGKTIAVFGCGPIGMCAVALCTASGAEKVFAVDINQYRLDLMEKLATHKGEVVTINSSKTDPVKEILKQTNGRGADVALEMSGHGKVLSQVFESLRPGGRISLVGIFAGEENVLLDVTDNIVFKAATIYGISGRMMYDTWYKTSAFLKSGKIDLRKIITHRFNGLEKMNEAMEIMASGKSGKVVIFP